MVHSQLWDNPQMPETQWVLKHIENDLYNIMNVKSQRFINVGGAEHHNGAWYRLFGCVEEEVMVAVGFNRYQS